MSTSSICDLPLEVKFENISRELQERSQWLGFKSEADTRGRLGKTPYSIKGYKAGVNQPAAWSDFETVREAYNNGEFDGLLFVLTEDDDLFGLDIDHVVHGNKITSWTKTQRKHLPAGFPEPRDIVELVGSYTEVSPSGTGLRIIGRGKLSGSGRKLGDFEIYDSRRLLSITGHCHTLSQVVEAQEAIDYLCDLIPERIGKDLLETLDWADAHPLGIRDDQIIRKLKRDLNALALWQGKLDGYSSRSEADLALVNHIAHFTGPYPVIIDRLFRRSKLCRDKWQDREDYRVRTLESALATKETFYLWPTSKQVLSDACLDYQGFPLESLPDDIARYAKCSADSIGVDVAMVAVPLLAVLAGLIGQSRKLWLKSTYSEVAILWTAVIAPVGAAKSASVKAAQLLMDRILKRLRKRNAEERARYEEELAEWNENKSGPKPLKPTPLQLLVQNSTLEALNRRLAANWKGLLYCKDELAGWIKCFNQYRRGADAESWLTLHNGECEVIDRAQDDAHTDRVDCAISLTGTVQPEVAKQVLFGKDTTQNGLAQRLLICEPPFEYKDDDGEEHKVPAELVNQMWRLGLQLYELEIDLGADQEPQPVVLRLEPEAKQLLLEFKNRSKREAHQIEGPLAGFCHKLNAQCARIALVLSVTRQILEEPAGGARGVVTVDDVRSAISITEWFRNEARRFYGRLEEDQEDQELRKTWEWIRSHFPNGITARELQQGRKHVRTADEAKELLLELADAGFGELQSRVVRSGPTPLEFLPRLAVNGSSTGKSQHTAKTTAKETPVDS